jgi:hypothetical protein
MDVHARSISSTQHYMPSSEESASHCESTAFGQHEDHPTRDTGFAARIAAEPISLTQHSKQFAEIDPFPSKPVTAS